MNIKYFSLLLVILASIVQSKAQSITGKQAVEDIDFLVKNIKDTHANPYLHISETGWDKEIERYKQKYTDLDSLQLANFSIDIQKLMALLGDAQSTAGFPEQALMQYPDSMQFFPFKIKLDAEGKLRLEDKSPIAGSALLKINGQDAMILYEEALSCLSGTLALKEYYLNREFFPIFLFQKGIYAPFEFKILEENSAMGFHTTFTLPNKYLISLEQVIVRLYPSNAPYELSFPKTDVALISYNECENYKGFKVFLDSTFQLLEQKNIEKLIIDIRYNSGGNSALNDLLLPYITQKEYRQSSGRHWKVSQTMKKRINQPLYQQTFGEKFIKQYKEAKNGTYLKGDEYPLTTPQKPKHFFEGKTCVLIGTQTLSSANSLADAIKTYKISTLIGKPTGKLTNDFGELIIFSIPHSKLTFTCSTAYDIGADGNAEKIEAVLPDIAVEGDALEYALEWLEK